MSLEAQLEARVLMMSTNNILHPANGKPIIVPTQDIVLGLYYLSLAMDNEPGEGMIFGSIAEIQHALDAKACLRLHAKIKARFTHGRREGKPVSHMRRDDARPHAACRAPAAQAECAASTWSTGCCTRRTSPT